MERILFFLFVALLIGGGATTTFLRTVPTPVPEPISMLLIGAILLSLAKLGGKRFLKK